MSRKPENTFRASVHKYFDPAALHHEKMANPYSSGTADDWYSGRPHPRHGQSRDLWIEWKFVIVPVRDDTLIDLVGGKKPDITHLQQHWLRERYNEGRNVRVGVGSANGGIILADLAWERPIPAGEFRTRMVSRKELADYIVSFVQGKPA